MGIHRNISEPQPTNNPVSNQPIEPTFETLLRDLNK